MPGGLGYGADRKVNESDPERGTTYAKRTTPGRAHRAPPPRYRFHPQHYTVATEHFATDAELNPTDPAASSTAQQAYIGNVNSKKFHLPSCANLPAEKNQILFSSYDEAVAAGYSPCSSCIK